MYTEDEIREWLKDEHLCNTLAQLIREGYTPTQIYGIATQMIFRVAKEVK